MNEEKKNSQQETNQNTTARIGLCLENINPMENCANKANILKNN